MRNFKFYYTDSIENWLVYDDSQLSLFNHSIIINVYRSKAYIDECHSIRKDCLVDELKHLLQDISNDK